MKKLSKSQLWWARKVCKLPSEIIFLISIILTDSVILWILFSFFEAGEFVEYPGPSAKRFLTFIHPSFFLEISPYGEIIFLSFVFVISYRLIGGNINQYYLPERDIERELRFCDSLIGIRPAARKLLEPLIQDVRSEYTSKTEINLERVQELEKLRNRIESFYSLCEEKRLLEERISRETIREIKKKLEKLDKSIKELGQEIGLSSEQGEAKH